MNTKLLSAIIIPERRYVKYTVFSPAGAPEANANTRPAIYPETEKTIAAERWNPLRVSEGLIRLNG